MGKVIGIVSIKGGVGKTSVSASLAADLANRCGKRVLLIDANYSAPNLGLHMDILSPEKTIHDALNGRIRFSSAIHSRYKVDVIPGSYVFDKRINSLRLRDKIKRVKDEYDFVIIDSSPSLNEEILSSILASDNLFIVSTPDYPTLSCSLKIAKLARQRDRIISGIILNKVKDSRYELNISEIEEAMGVPVIAKLNNEMRYDRALFYRMPMSIYDKKSKFSREIHNLSLALINGKEGRSIFKSIFSFNKSREEVNRQILKESFYTK